MFTTLSTFTLNRCLPTDTVYDEDESEYVITTVNAAGEIVLLSSLDETARDAAAITAEAGPLTQMWCARPTNLPAGNWQPWFWAVGQNIETDAPVAIGDTLFWDGSAEVDVARLQLVILPAVLTVNQSGAVKKVTL